VFKVVLELNYTVILTL